MEKIYWGDRERIRRAEKIRRKNEKKKDDEAKETLEKLNKDYEELEFYGRKLQKIGLNIVEQSKIGKDYTQFQLSELPKYSMAANEYQQFNSVVENVCISGNIAFNRTQRALDLVAKGEVYVAEAVPLISGATSTCSSSTYDAMTVINQVIVDSNRNDFYVSYNLKIPTIAGEIKLQADLDRELNKINPRYSKRRKGAWNTFNSVSADRKSQAAHSMRDIFREILFLWAPNNKVEKIEWWKNSGKDKVDHRDRVRFLLYGDKEVKNQDELQSINHEIDNIYKSFDLLQKTAHGSNQELQLVESTMKSIESTMLRIINIRNEKFE